MVSSQTSRDRERLRQQVETDLRHRRRALWLSIGALVLALVVIATLVVVGQHRRDADRQAADRAAQGQVLVQALTSVPAATFDTVGVGASSAGPQAIEGGRPDLTMGKPRLLYVGAGFCPYCAMTRLSLVAALSRFGQFSGLTQALSSADDKPANIPTVSFHGSTYTSDRLVFSPYEVSDRDHNSLDTLTAADNSVLGKYDPQGSIPFLYWGTSQSGTPFDGDFLSGQTPDQVAKALKDPASQQSRAIIGGANVLTAQVCRLTGNKPTDVCTSAGVKAAAAKWLK